MRPDIPDTDHSFLPTLDEAFAAHADAVCARFEGRAVSYADVDELSAQVANALQRDGFTPGQHGAVYSTNSIDAFVAALGIVRAGGVWVPLNPRNSAQINLDILTRFGCDALLYQPAHAATASEVAERLGGIQVRLGGDVDSGSQARVPPRRRSSAVAPTPSACPRPVARPASRRV